MSSKKACILASVCSMIDQFNLPNIALLQSKGYEVHVVTNFENGSTTTQERVNQVRQMLEDQGVKTIHMPIPRSIFDVKGILDSLSQMKKLCKEDAYELIHCHSPVGGVIARLGGRKSRRVHGTRMIYTAHGFHFYKGAPKQNWLIFYPIEWVCSFFTDVLITINTEDYAFAKKHMKAGKVEYVPGIGIDMEKYQTGKLPEKRQEFGIGADELIFLSVGELNENKNHITAIRAMEPGTHYLIAGRGNKEEELKAVAKERQVDLRLLGYRTDIQDLLRMADVFVFPSYREGLSVSLMEAMSCGLPCVVSKIRGNVDLIDDGKGGYRCNPAVVDEFVDALRKLQAPDIRKCMSEWNREKIRKFSNEVVMQRIKAIYF